MLFKIARDIIFETFRKYEMGKVTHRKCEINRKHSKAEELDPDLIQDCGQEWQVKSNSDMSLYYVKLEKKTCDCKLRCEKCNVCVHTYSCTCLDATLHYTVCKHVHLVHMHREQEGQSEDQQVNPSKDQQDNSPSEDTESEDQHGQPDNQSEDYQSEDQHGQPDNQSEDYQSEDQHGQPDNQSEDYQSEDQHGQPDNQSEDYQSKDQQDQPDNQSEDKQNEDQCNTHDSQENVSVTINNVHGYYARMLNQNNCRSRLSALREDIRLLILKLDSLQKQCDCADTLSNARKHINNAIITLECSLTNNLSAECTPSLPVMKRCSPNANSEKQRKRCSPSMHNEKQSFYATKKKRPKSQNSSPKPTSDEAQSSRLLLADVEVLVCGICFKEDDNAVDDLVEWIECENCGMWAYYNCAFAKGDDFCCRNCL